MPSRSSARDIRPTEVQDWKLCPQYWQFKHVEGWLPKAVHKWEVQAWIGTAIHAGIHAWVRQEGLPVEMASASLLTSQATALSQTREVPPLEEALATVRANTKKFCAQAPTWLQTRCRGSEVRLGAARLDWIGTDEYEDWLVVDFKTKRTKPRNLEAYQWGLRRSWQMAEYVARARIHPDSPAAGQVVTKAEVQTIILDKFEVIVDAFTPMQWSESERLKIRMEMQDPVVWRNEQHCRNWFGGDCSFLRACWEYDRDAHRMQVDYVQGAG